MRALMLVLALLPSSALAECFPLPAIVGRLTAEGATVVRLIPIDETGTQIMVVRAPNGFYSAFTVRDLQCVWMPPVPLGPEIAVKAPGTPA